MGPESHEVVIPPLEPPKEFTLANHSYVDAVVGRLAGEAEKTTPEYFRSRIETAIEQGRIDDRLSPGSNITSLLKAGENVGVTFSPIDQWKFYQTGHMKAAELLSQQAFSDVGGRDYYHEEAQKAQRKALEIQALLEQQDTTNKEDMVPNHGSETLQEPHRTVAGEQESHPEDEFVDSVEGVSITGVFPNGLILNGKGLVRPGPKRGFDDYSDTKFTLSQNRYIRAAEGMFSQQQSPRLTIPHAVAIFPTHRPITNFVLMNLPFHIKRGILS